MRYIARTRLSLADGTHIEPGQPVELSDRAAAILLLQDAVGVPLEALRERLAEVTAPSLESAAAMAELGITPPATPRSTRRKR